MRISWLWALGATDDSPSEWLPGGELFKVLENNSKDHSGVLPMVRKCQKFPDDLTTPTMDRHRPFKCSQWPARFTSAPSGIPIDPALDEQ
jgi:hypothetical protein